MRKRILINSVAISLILSAVLFFTPAFAKAEPPKTIKIGALVDLTGAIGTMGKRWLWTFRKGVEMVNKDGGVYVKEFDKKIPMELIPADGETNEEKAVLQAEYLCQQKVVAIAATGAALPGGAAVFEKNRIPGIMSASILRQPYDQGYKYLFSNFMRNDDLAKSMINILGSIPKDQRPTLIAVFEAQDVFGKEGSVYGQKEATANGYKVMALKYTRLAKDLSSQILEAKQAGADMMYGGMFQPDGILLMKQIKELDYNPKMMIIHSAAADTTAWGSLGRDGEYVLAGAHFHWSFTYPGAKELAALFQAEFGEKAWEGIGACYANILIIAEAIKKAGTLDSKKIRDAIAATNMMTVVGPVKFRENGTSIVDPALLQWQKGVDELVWPKNVRTKKLIYPMPKWKER
jgi:branched-chain amino acid transport system substrate-binding protein